MLCISIFNQKLWQCTLTKWTIKTTCKGAFDDRLQSCRLGISISTMFFTYHRHLMRFFCTAIPKCKSERYKSLKTLGFIFRGARVYKVTLMALTPTRLNMHFKFKYTLVKTLSRNWFCINISILQSILHIWLTTYVRIWLKNWHLVCNEEDFYWTAVHRFDLTSFFFKVLRVAHAL